MGAGGAPRMAPPSGRNFEEAITSRAAELVKGVGHVTKGRPLDDAADGAAIFTKSHDAILRTKAAVTQGTTTADTVLAAFSREFTQHPQFAGTYAALKASADVQKNFTAQNLGAANAPYGLVPFDLAAPSRLVYPVYTLFRNKFPRPAGQGLSKQVYGLLGISGSQTGGQGVVDISLPELVQSGQTGITSTWPLNIPGAGKQTQYRLNVPYRFFGLSESLSWLAQFQGQGFEDISALANLVLLQEMMLGEEYQLLAGSSQNLATPAAATVAVRTAGSNETAVTGFTTNIAVRVTALNYFGETAAVSSSAVNIATGQVADVTISPVPGAQQYNVYVGTNTPGNTNANYWLQIGTTVQAGVTTAGTQSANAVGGIRVTIQGALATAGAHPPTTDSGTGSSQRMEGLIPVLSGLSDTGAGPYANVGLTASNVWQGGYVNQSVGTHLSTNAIFTALDGMWEANGLNNVAPGVFRADPSEIVADGGDLMRLANDMLLQGNSLNYLLNISQDQVSGMRAGAAVAEFVNPVTRSTVKLTVHPFLSQGTALLMSYQLPQTWSHVDNAWEMTCVQDYCSVAWPVIDATFRYSIFLLGALVAQAPFYSGILQGLQVSDVSPFS